jgi:hypothetical protein
VRVPGAGRDEGKLLRHSRRGSTRAEQPEKVSRRPPIARAVRLAVLVADPRPSLSAMKREVGAEPEVEITAPTTLEFQISVARHPNTEVSERLSFCARRKSRPTPRDCTVIASISWTPRWAT